MAAGWPFCPDRGTSASRLWSYVLGWNKMEWAGGALSVPGGVKMTSKYEKYVEFLTVSCHGIKRRRNLAFQIKSIFIQDNAPSNVLGCLWHKGAGNRGAATIIPWPWTYWEPVELWGWAAVTWFVKMFLIGIPIEYQYQVKHTQRMFISTHIVFFLWDNHEPIFTKRITSNQSEYRGSIKTSNIKILT